MVATFSPHGDAGGTLHFPSPTHIRHVDAASAFKQLRRSLSRSPSKGPAFRLVTSKSASPSPSSPLSPSRVSIPNRSASTSLLSLSDAVQPSPLAVPYSSSLKKNRSSTRKLSPMGVSSRSRSSQRSPGRVTLNDSSDNGNATPRSSAGSNEGVENRIDQSFSSSGEATIENVSKMNGTGLRETSLAPHRVFANLGKSNGNSAAKSSPLKRSDGIMNLDQANLGSPSAKRRSIHGTTLGPDFDIFDHEAAFQDFFESRSLDGPNLDTSSSLDHSNKSPLPRRTSYLRRTTLQQRHEKPGFPKPRLNPDLGLDFATPAPKSRFRMSLDNFLPAMARDSPFSSQGSLPNASVHPLSQYSNKPSNIGLQDKPQRHPLSRTITQSSSNSSIAEDSPTHIPHRQPEQRRAFVDFSKSLPVGVARPVSSEGTTSNFSSQDMSTEKSFSTPENYKLAKPLPAAFMSTGLVSKRHKDVEDLQNGFHGGRSMMPDTPCKRHSLIGESPSVPLPDTAIGKARNIRHSFGTPSTPFNLHSSRPASESLGKGISIFGSNFNGRGANRRGSFLSVDGDDHSQSPAANIDSQSSNDFELPPTPTKQAIAATPSQNGVASGGSAKSILHIQDLEAPSGPRPRASQFNENSKSILIGVSKGNVDGAQINIMESPSVALRFRSYFSIPSFTSSRSLRNFKSRTPPPLQSCTSPFTRSRKSETKPSPLSPASPIQERREQMSPHTPRESMIPPDPSRLSISAHTDGPSFQPLTDLASSTAVFPPATPTASRESFHSLGNGKLSLSASHNVAMIDIDPSITRRFDKVELIGTGEFSHVYRVTKTQEAESSRSYFSLQATRSSPKTPIADRVWAVKKSRHAYIGPKDRQRKIQEVKVLKALAHAADHTVHFFDSWEERNHLFIQTEFCEEGSLDLFLKEVGLKARLDDFRTWKILLEISLGLKHIHHSGFIHLDLKPANIFITFEGVLKIGDFGLATPWPALPGTDHEGDREYIGPEVLMGHFDKPSDIFALGLIMLEIAGNVMLPENGVSWQRLRSGDMSDVPSLTFSSETSTVFRDSSGKPLPQDIVVDCNESESGNEDFNSPSIFHPRGEMPEKKRPGKAQFLRSGELSQPPAFMIDANHEEALDNLVRWMISPESSDRPVVDQILVATGVKWAEARRRAGATIYEGNWGPADAVLADDAEMIDV